MKNEILIKSDECTGCCYCADNLSSVFKMDEKQIAYVYHNNEADISAIEDVIENCPAECIVWAKK